MLKAKKTIFYSTTIALLFIAMLPIPSELYYHFLRVAVTVASVFAFYNLVGRSNLLWIDFAILTIIFNPLVPLPIEREAWTIIDMLAILAFIRLILTERRIQSEILNSQKKTP